MRWALVFLVACGSDPLVPVGLDGGTFCEPPLKICGADCVSTEADPLHCGGCGRECPPSTFCNRSACSALCSDGLTACGAACADLATERTHCGRCDRVCPGDRECESGECVCPTGTTECNGACVNTSAERDHCGVCNRRCEADQVCSMGSCVCAGGMREADCHNSVDDDCDDQVDCADPDCVGTTRACMGSCGMGTETCLGSSRWGACEGGNGTAELCGDGIDQDCSGDDLREPDQWEPNDACDACPDISSDEDPNTTLMPSFDSVADSVDCFRFRADDGISYPESIRVRLTNIPPGHDYDVFLYENRSACDARDPLAYGNASGNANEEVEWTENFGSDDDGTYYVRVVRFQGYDCRSSYTLSINGLR